MARSQRGKLSAVPVYLILSGGGALFSTMVFTVNLIYQVQQAHLNPLQLVLVGTALEATAFIFEIPTGLVADVYSRRLSILIGCFLVGIGLALQGVVPVFGVIVLAQVIWGLGYTFTSGATEAWIADEVGEEHVGALFLRAAQVSQFCGIAGVIVGVVLGTVRLNLPILVGGVLYVALAVFLCVTMPEHGFTPVPRDERDSWKQMGETIRTSGKLVRHSPALLTILGIAAFWGAASEGFDRLNTDHWLTNLSFPAAGHLKPVVWFGILGIGARFLTIGATEIVRRRVDTRSHGAVARALCLCTGLIVVGVIAFAQAQTFALALIASWAVAVLRRVEEPLQAAWLNQHVDSRVRATIFSVSGQADAIGQITGGPVIGYVGLLRGVRAALTLAGFVLAPALALYTRTIRRDQRDALLVEDVEV